MTSSSRRAISTAKDRLWQIDLWRRIGSGKLAEVLGSSAIDRDCLAARCDPRRLECRMAKLRAGDA